MVRDPLAEVLSSVRLDGGVFLDVHLTAPWCLLSQVTADNVRPMLQSPAQMIAYHFITEGQLIMSVAGEAPMAAQAGDVILFPRNDVHILASGEGLQPVDASGVLVRPATNGELARVSYGGGGAAIIGFQVSWLARKPQTTCVAALPPMLKLDVRAGTSRDWIEASMQFAVTELIAGRLPTSHVMSRLSELLLVEAVRGYAASLGEQQTGWLRAFADPPIGQALALMHRDLAVNWSAAGLAKAVALSRSAFVERFTALVGLPPIRYLTVSRLQAARLLLREARMPIAGAAHAVGYESEEAFSRAFKREFGTPPARWRDGV
jgi:AraC-like DNA-binding protein